MLLSKVKLVSISLSVGVIFCQQLNIEIFELCKNKLSIFSTITEIIFLKLIKNCLFDTVYGNHIIFKTGKQKILFLSTS